MPKMAKSVSEQIADVEKDIERISKEQDKVGPKALDLRNQVKALAAERNEAEAKLAALHKVARMSDAERAALHQVVEGLGNIESAEAHGEVQ